MSDTTEPKARELDCDKLFQAYEEARADNTAHLRKIIELQKRIEKLEVNRIHTCHDQCQKIECVQRRRIEELEAENKKLRDALGEGEK